MELTRLGDINYPYLEADSDLSNDKVHTELLKDLNAAGQKAGVVLRITTAKSDHDPNVSGTDTPSRHMSQTAVDISRLDGINSWNEKGTATNSNLGNPEFRKKGNKVKDALVSMGYTWNREKGNPKAVLWLTDAGGNHYNHLHVSNDPTKKNWTPTSSTGSSDAKVGSNSDFSTQVSRYFDEWGDLNKLLYKHIYTENTEPTIVIQAPLDNMPSKINHPFGEKRSYEIHPGVDLGVPSGSPVKAPMDGEVVNVNSNGRLCGGTIDIDYKNGFWSRFCHIKRIDVKKGDIVKQGQVVGLSGGGANDPQKGNSKGAHLHFTLKKDGQLVDPMKYINKTVDASQTELGSEKAGESNGNFSTQVKKYFDEWGDLNKLLYKHIYSESQQDKIKKDISRIRELLK